MNEQEYIEIQMTMGLVFKQIDAMPLDELVKNIDYALSIGPYVDPTLYMQKAEDTQRWLRITKAFKTCRDTIKKEFEEKPN